MFFFGPRHTPLLLLGDVFFIKIQTKNWKHFQKKYIMGPYQEKCAENCRFRAEGGSLYIRKITTQGPPPHTRGMMRSLQDKSSK